jgi:hypothetical protein
MIAACALALSLAAAADTIGPPPPAARQVAGVVVPEAVALRGRPLALNGAGLRRKLFFEVYVGALYLPARRGDAAAILAAADPWQVTLTFRRHVDHDRLLEAFVQAFQQNSPGELDRLRGDLERFHAVLADVEEGQVLTLHYLPGEGTTLTSPGGAAATVPGHLFGEAMLRTWLGAHPADEGLKAALLGR